MDWRLGGDLGTNSFGTSVFSLDHGDIDDLHYLGVRIFPDGRDPKSLASSNMDRRAARLAARGFERKSRRKLSLLKLLIPYGLAPAEPAARALQAALDPYFLRKTGLDIDLTATEFGRVLMSLNRRRGFKSSRLDAEEDAADLGLIASGIESLEQALRDTAARSLGEHLYQRQQAKQAVRVRATGSGKDKAYALYPSRSMIEREFDLLWSRQAAHLGLTEDQKRAIHQRIFYQRPLKPMIPGFCTFLRDQPRAAKAQPLAQRFEIVQKVNNLRYNIGQGQQPLSTGQRRILIESLARQGEMSFAGLRKALKLPRDAWINLESETLKKLPGNVTAQRLSAADGFGAGWWDLPPADQQEIVAQLLSATETDALAAWLIQRFGVTAEQAGKMAKTRLPQGHLRLSLAALEKIVPLMEQGELEDKDGCMVPITYDKAVEQALGLNHAVVSSSSHFDRLPYYGAVLERFCVAGTGNPDDLDEQRYGRIANPTVHVALNQVRLTVNGLIERFGNPPGQVVVEIGRDLPLGAKAKHALKKEQSQNQKANETRDAQMKGAGLTPSGILRLKLRLWEELDGKDPLGKSCVYTGRPISLSQALSAETEIDHILPYRLTLDDSAANKVLVFRDANRRKARRTPYAAFGPGSDEPGILPWDEIMARAKQLGRKSWRFSADALEIFEKNRDFLDRQLVDMQYISRLAREYFQCLFEGEPNSRPVWVVPGRVTAMIRGKLGLNDLLGVSGVKNREDHRHHAVDAFVVGLTSRSFLQKIAAAAARTDEAKIERLLTDMPVPYAKFDRAAVQAMLDAMVVSHKVDHGRNGQLHKETSYGIVDPLTHEGFTLVFRKPLISLSNSEIDQVKDKGIRQHLREAIPSFLSEKDLQIALSQFSKNFDIYRVKVLVKKDSYISIKDKAGKPYKAVAYSDFQRVDVWLIPGEKVPKFVEVSRFAANQRNADGCYPTPESTRPNRGARKIMSIHKGDTMAIEENGQRRLMVVVQIEPANQRLQLLQHNVSRGKGDKKVLEQYSFLTLVKLGFRKVHVSPTGEVKDGGPRLPVAPK